MLDTSGWWNRWTFDVAKLLFLKCIWKPGVELCVILQVQNTAPAWPEIVFGCIWRRGWKGFADLCRQQPNATSITIHNLNATGKPIFLVAFLCMVTTKIQRQLVLFAALPFSFIHGPFFSPFQSHREVPSTLLSCKFPHLCHSTLATFFVWSTPSPRGTKTWLQISWQISTSPTVVKLLASGSENLCDVEERKSYVCCFHQQCRQVLYLLWSWRG